VLEAQARITPQLIARRAKSLVASARR